MDSGLYAAYSGLLARTQALDLAANNLANAGTSGFRAERETFRGVMADATSQLASQVGGAVNSFGVLGASSLSSAQGQISPTGNPLDLAIPGQCLLRDTDSVWHSIYAGWRVPGFGGWRTDDKSWRCSAGCERKDDQCADRNSEGGRRRQHLGDNS